MQIISKLYEEEMRTVYGFFMVKTMNRQKAEDLTGEVFVTTMEQLQVKRDIKDPKKYMYGVMKLVWIRHLRQKYDKPVNYIEDIEDFASYTTQEVKNYQDSGLAQKAERYISALPIKQRTVMELRFISGMSLREICNHLDKNMNYVKTTQKRGIASMKKLVNDEVTQGVSS